MNPMQLETYALAAGLRFRKIDLATAREKEEIGVQGDGADVFFCDYRTDGTATLFLQDPASNGFPVKKQSGMSVEFDKLFITNTAQAGKFLYLWYGRGFRFLQPNADITSIGTVDLVSAITPPEHAQTGYRRNSISSALNTIVAPAANTAGVRVSYASLSAYDHDVRMMIKQSAPATYQDGTALLNSEINAVSAERTNYRTDEFIVPAGFGIYEQASGATNLTSVELAYQVL